MPLALADDSQQQLYAQLEAYQGQRHGQQQHEEQEQQKKLELQTLRREVTALQRQLAQQV